MAKRVIFAVAGSGKTTLIIDSLSLDKRALIVTYTENNYHHLRNKIICKFGCIPENITVQTYFTFLYSFCYKPFLHYKYRSKGINWDVPPAFTLRLGRTDRKFYLDQSLRLYNNRIAKLVEIDNVLEHVQKRLCKYYDQFFVDEVQDFGGHDFNLLKEVCKAKLDVCLVGDFYQHTFDTSRDGQTNVNLYKDFQKYQKHFLDVGLFVDKGSLSKSYRCPPDVCEFVRKTLGIEIESHKKKSSGVHFLNDEGKITEFFRNNDVVKLFFQEHYKYPCYSNNWGKAKGIDKYIDVCISLYPKALKGYEKSDFSELPASSKNKLYVACTRANRSLYFVNEAKLNLFKIE